MSYPLLLRPRIDWVLLLSSLVVTMAGLITMNSFGGSAEDSFFGRQTLWITVGLALYYVASRIDWRFLKNSWLLVSIFFVSVSSLIVVLFASHLVKGAHSWIDLGFASIQPSDFAKLVLVIVLAKYFSRRHVEIAQIRHVIVSGLYALVPFFLIMAQPDFGSAIIIVAIWFGMIFVSGVSKKHLIAVFICGLCSVLVLWIFVFKPYQKNRILTFFSPTSDVRGAGYNALQSQIAVGSGMLLGKGIGYGTQSRLRFLPEYETDFIFAAFAEEWGFVGCSVLFVAYSLMIGRILSLSNRGGSNFESLFGFGVAFMFAAHFVINIGMNVGLTPITGITLPFMSYGGSHLVTEFLALGMLSSMARYGTASHREVSEQELLQVTS